MQDPPELEIVLPTQAGAIDVAFGCVHHLQRLRVSAGRRQRVDPDRAQRLERLVLVATDEQRAQRHQHLVRRTGRRICVSPPGSRGRGPGCGSMSTVILLDVFGSGSGSEIKADMRRGLRPDPGHRDRLDLDELIRVTQERNAQESLGARSAPKRSPRARLRSHQPSLPRPGIARKPRPRQRAEECRDDREGDTRCLGSESLVGWI